MKTTGTEVDPYIRNLKSAIEACQTGRMVNLAGDTLPALDIDPGAALDLRPHSEGSDHPLVSTSPVGLEGEEIGELVLMTVGPGQTIGDRTLAGHPEVPKVLPVLGGRVTHFPVCTTKRSPMPIAFVNNFDLLRIDGNATQRLGTVGQTYYRFLSVVENGWFAEYQEPEASSTTPFHANGDSPDTPNALHNPHERFTQVSGFIALNGTLPEGHPLALGSFTAQPPGAHSI